MVNLSRGQMGLSIRGGFRQNVELFMLIFFGDVGVCGLSQGAKTNEFEKCLL